MEQAYISQGSSIDKGENARLSSFVGAIAMADLVKTTLGPAGLDKILQSIGNEGQGSSISVTNDGATILRRVHVDNAAARVLVNMSKVQDEQVGDGTTSVVVLAGELLRQAEGLVLDQRLHPQTVASGWRDAVKVAQQALESVAKVKPSQEEWRAQLLQVAKTTLSSKLLHYEKDLFANLAVDAVLRLTNDSDNQQPPDLQLIQVIKKPGGSLRDSYLEEGFLLDQKKPGVGQPQALRADSDDKPLRILLANTSMDTDKIKIYGSRVQVDSLDKIAAVETAEKMKIKQKVDRILDHKIDCFINRQLIYNYPESLFAEANVMAVEHADFDGIERLAAVLGGEVVSTFESPEGVVMGECKVIEEVFIGEDKILRFGGCKAGGACSIVLRGASSHVLDEAERSLHDALSILVAAAKDPRTVYGGGCTEVLMAQAVDKAAQETPGKKALAMSAFAKALRQLPMTVADNGGYDAAELLTQLQAAHAAGQVSAGLDMTDGSVGDMEKLGVREAFTSKLHVVKSAAEAAEMILRVDDIIKAAPRQRSEYGY